MAWEEVGGYGGGYDDRGSALPCHRVRVTAAGEKVLKTRLGAKQPSESVLSGAQGYISCRPLSQRTRALIPLHTYAMAASTCLTRFVCS